MKMNKQRTGWVWWVGALAFVVVVASFASSLHQKEKLVLWSDQYWSRAEIVPILKAEACLKNTIIPQIDFVDVSFYSALDELGSLIDQYDLAGEGLDIRVHEFVPDELPPITLRLETVPAREGLRYLSALAQLKFVVDERGLVLIVPLEYDQSVEEEGWFPAGIHYVETYRNTSERVDVTADLVSQGVTFSEGAEAYYDPGKELIWARNTRDQMELIDLVLTPGCQFYEPTLQDRAYDLWMRLTGGYSSAPAATPIAPAAPDPFGGGEPDPFGGGASNPFAP